MPVPVPPLALLPELPLPALLWPPGPEPANATTSSSTAAGGGGTPAPNAARQTRNARSVSPRSTLAAITAPYIPAEGCAPDCCASWIASARVASLASRQALRSSTYASAGTAGECSRANRTASAGRPAPLYDSTSERATRLGAAPERCSIGAARFSTCAMPSGGQIRSSAESCEPDSFDEEPNMRAASARLMAPLEAGLARGILQAGPDTCQL